MTTNCGPITIALDTAGSPKTTASFASLTKKGFYDGTSFNRVVANFVIQGGDPLEDRTGGPGYSVVEKPSSKERYAAGTVAMAKGDTEAPGTSGSQFFIVLADGALPTPDYAVVGKVVSGQSTVDKISALATGQDEGPTETVVISKAKLKRG